MKYVDWVERVLRATVELQLAASRSQMLGAPQIAARLGFEQEEEIREPLGDALRDLERLDLIDMKSYWLIAIDQEARKIQVASLRTSWPRIHEIYIDEKQVAFLRGVCELSEQRAEDRAWLANVHGYDVCDHLGWERDSDLVADLVFSLRDGGLLDASRVTMGGGWNIFPTYVGMVRATESESSELRDLVVELLPDWETANVDFKRELHLDTKDQKAEFVRDLLGLANPRVTGKRYLVIGWDPVTHEFTTPVDPAVIQDRIEDLLWALYETHSDGSLPRIRVGRGPPSRRHRGGARPHEGAVPGSITPRRRTPDHRGRRGLHPPRQPWRSGRLRRDRRP